MDLDTKKPRRNGYFKSREVMTSKWGECENRRNIAVFGMCGGHRPGQEETNVKWIFQEP